MTEQSELISDGDPVANGGAGAEKVEQGSKKGPAPTKRLPTPRIAYAKQLDLLRAYAAASGQGAKPVENKDVADIVGMTAATVSLANPFFADLALLVRQNGGYIPDKTVVSFSRVYQWDPEKAGVELAPRLRESWFGDLLLKRLEYGPMSEADALTLLGTEAEAGPAYRGQIQTLLDFLQTAGLIGCEGGQVSAIRGAAMPEPEVTERTAEPAPEHKKTAMAPDPPPAAPGRSGLPLLIQGLLEQLPTTDTWSRAEANKWLELARLTFDVVYKIPDDPKGGDSD
jgi:hypothetical protein